MSIKQGDYLKELRVKNNLSQEKLGAELGLSRQSISKWEQGYAMPDTENLLKLSELYGVSVDTILKCGETEESEETEEIIENEEAAETEKEEIISENPALENAEEKAEPKIIFIEKQEYQEKKPHKKRGWLFISYPIWMVVLYAVIGSCFGAKGWFTGWIVLLTIPLFYTGIIAFEKKKPVIFCYPVLATLIYLALGFFANLWHPMWILFLTIPIFYIVCVTRKIK
ncbi:MAG: helix-turn-helix transcriptional regulator [Eubacterium sp.]|nr:helix-turn-helix transcriptional regulator [Eubacterium sp.]